MPITEDEARAAVERLFEQKGITEYEAGDTTHSEGYEYQLGYTLQYLSNHPPKGLIGKHTVPEPDIKFVKINSRINEAGDDQMEVTARCYYGDQ